MNQKIMCSLHYLRMKNNDIVRVGFQNEQSRFARARKYFEKIYRKKIFYFANFSNVRKNFEEKNLTSKLKFF